MYHVLLRTTIMRIQLNERQRTWATLVVLVILTILLRLPLLSSSFWLDEAAQALESSRPWHQQLAIAADFQPPGLHLLLHVVQYFGHQEWWLRVWSGLLPAIITVVSLWGIAQAQQKSKAFFPGAIAAGLLATNSFHIFYSQELRPYAWTAALISLSWWLLLKNFPLKRTTLKSQIWNWLALSGVWIAGFYSTYLFPFGFLGQVAWMGWQIGKDVQKNKSFRLQTLNGPILALVVSVIMFSLWLPGLFSQLVASSALRQTAPEWEHVVSFSSGKNLLLLLGKFIFGISDLSVSLQYLLPLALVMGLLLWWVVAVMIQAYKRAEKPLIEICWLLIAWVILPLLVVTCFTLFLPIVQPKRLLFLLPGIYVCLEWLFWYSWPNNWTRKLAATSIIYLLGLNLFGWYTYLTNPNLQREPWRELHQELVTAYPASSSIAVFAFDAPFAPWQWYDHDQYPTLSLGSVSATKVSDWPQLLKPITQYRFVLVFSYLQDITDPERQLQKEIEAYGYSAAATYTWPLIGSITVYTVPSTRQS